MEHNLQRQLFPRLLQNNDSESNSGEFWNDSESSVSDNDFALVRNCHPSNKYK